MPRPNPLTCICALGVSSIAHRCTEYLCRIPSNWEGCRSTVHTFHMIQKMSIYEIIDNRNTQQTPFGDLAWTVVIVFWLTYSSFNTCFRYFCISSTYTHVSTLQHIQESRPVSEVASAVCVYVWCVCGGEITFDCAMRDVQSKCEKSFHMGVTSMRHVISPWSSFCESVCQTGSPSLSHKFMLIHASGHLCVPSCKVSF